MLIRYFSGLTPIALGLPVTSTGATLEVSGLVGEPLSTTSAGFCSSVGVVVQAPRNRTDVVTDKAAIRIARTTCLLSFYERAPRGLADVPSGDAQSLLDAPVGRNRREHALAADHRGEQDHASVGREARRLVAVAVSDDLQLLVCQIEQCHLELAAIAG